MDTSSCLNARLSQPDDNNWVKGNLILRELKTGLAPFLDEKAKDLQAYVCRHVPASSIACTVCTKKNLTKSTYVCPSGICTKILKDINTQYIHHPPGMVKLINTDNKEWCDTSRYWEIAKAYISTPGYASERSAAETDSCVGLLTIIINCTWFQNFLAVGLAVFERIKVARNAMMHSGNIIMSSGELDNLFDDCVQVLQDSLYLAADLTAQGALARIREIKDQTLPLSGIDLPDVTSIMNEVKAHQEEDSEAIEHLKVWQQLAEKIMEELAKQQTKQQQDMSQIDRRVKRQRTEDQRKISKLGTNVSKLGTNVSNLDATVSQLDTTVSSHMTEGSALPIEIQRMDDKAVELYKTALEEGKVDDHSIRIMIIGHFGVGKTTLARRLLGKRVRIEERVSTDGIDVKVCPCKVSLSDLTWHSLQPDEKSDTALIRLAKMIASRSTGEDNAPTSADEDIFKTTAAKTESSFRAVGGAKQIVDVQGDDMLNIRGKLETQPINKPSDDKDEDTACIKEIKALVAEMRVTGTFDPGEFASVSLWDFAGQYVFYTTHQMFLSQRAVYLLVTDISKHIDDVFMKDECYFDSSGPKQCTISEFIDFWLNSIHTCSPDDPGDESTVPPVILVGTHADKLTEATVTDDADFCQRKENGSRDKLASDYFKAVQYHLCDKPTRFHLANEDFDIDNTIIDSKLEDLKKKIVEVAKQQPHWGKPIPAKWLRLETVLCGLKEKGLKIVDFEVIEGLNLAMSVPISTPEGLELFLQFHHQSGKILYFSEGSLKEKVVLDPQWLVDALKSLITAEMFSPKNRSHVMKEWNEFHKNGILRPQLLDAVWQIEKHPSFHNNRTHLLALMEKMNLISGPINTWHEDDATLTKEEYHLAPCMLKDTPSKDLLSPSQGEDCETTSILVFNFQKKFLPPAIFHRLLAACLSHWSLWRQGSCDLIFCGCGVFKIDQSHKLTLVSRDFTIQAFVTKYDRNEKIPREEICIAVLDFLDKSLKSVTGCIALSSLYTLCIKCPENKSNAVDAIIPVSKLKEGDFVCSCNDTTDTHVINSVDMLKYWFPDSVNTGYIPGLKTSIKDEPLSRDSDDSEDGKKKEEKKRKETQEGKKEEMDGYALPKPFSRKGPVGRVLHDDIWKRWEQSIDDSNLDGIQSLLKTGDLPDNDLFGQLCDNEGLDSNIVKNVCDTIGRAMKTDSEQILCVWSGYRPDNEEQIVFVACTSVGTRYPKPFVVYPLNTFSVIFRGANDFSSEAKDILYSREGMDKMFTERERQNIRICIQENSKQLMHNHSNLTMISASPVRSEGFGTEISAKKPDTCIVLYLHVKGVVPLSEKPFPKLLKDSRDEVEFPVDVREGGFVNLSGHKASEPHPHLRIGCQIGSDWNPNCKGTLGAFVNLPDGTLGCITCAHVLLSDKQLNILREKEMVEVTDLQNVDNFSRIRVFQPAVGKETPIGHVCKAIFRVGGIGVTGVDVALVKLTDEQRHPITGCVPDGDHHHAGFTEEIKMHFSSGESSSCEPKDTEYEAGLLKFGSRSGITRGSFHLHGSSIRRLTHSGQEMDFGFELHDQIECLSTGSAFAKHGDSGALVFIAKGGDHQKLKAVGIVEGGTTMGTVVLTPIWEVLDALGLQNTFKVFQHGSIFDRQSNAESTVEATAQCSPPGVCPSSSSQADTSQGDMMAAVTVTPNNNNSNSNNNNSGLASVIANVSRIDSGMSELRQDFKKQEMMLQQIMDLLQANLQT